jgi:hypothetical protein
MNQPRSELMSHPRMRAVVPIAVAVGLVAAAPAADAKAPPQARASGGDVVELTYPSIVRTHVTRAERAFDRATRKIENDKAAAAARPLKVVRRQIAAAWRGAKYKIRTTPPPPADDARVHAHARPSGDGPTGPTYASPADSGFRVLTLQHDVAADITQLLDEAPDASLEPLTTTLQFALDNRDGALDDILTLAPPAPSDDDEDAGDARVQVHASGDGPVVSTFETVMPNVLPQLDDELDAIEGTTSDDTDLTPGGRNVLTAAETQIRNTRTVVNAHWPPIPDED